MSRAAWRSGSERGPGSSAGSPQCLSSACGGALPPPPPGIYCTHVRTRHHLEKGKLGDCWYCCYCCYDVCRGQMMLEGEIALPPGCQECKHTTEDSGTGLHCLHKKMSFSLWSQSSCQVFEDLYSYFHRCRLLTHTSRHTKRSALLSSMWFIIQLPGKVSVASLPLHLLLFINSLCA